MLDLTQDEIMKCWNKKYAESPIVSVCCTAYNHEKYIEQCLDSILIQKTNFPFEIIVHDDASTDSTSRIIKRYEEKYSLIIKAIYEKENQYSKNNESVNQIINPMLKGEYIAICEGDDRWLCDKKLQKQYELLEKHPNIDICSHSAYIYKDGCKIGYINPRENDCIIDINDVIKGSGSFVATNSIMYRRRILDEKYEFEKFYPIDYTLQIHGSLRGGMLYISDFMSIYNSMTTGSWSERIGKTIDGAYKTKERIKKMFDIFNVETKLKYKESVNEVVDRYDYLYYLKYGPIKKCFSRKYIRFLKEESILNFLRMFKKAIY